MDRWFLPANYCFVAGVLLWGLFCKWPGKGNITLSPDRLTVSCMLLLAYLLFRSFFHPLFIRSIYLFCAGALFLLLRCRNLPQRRFDGIIAVCGVLQAAYGCIQYFGIVPQHTYFPVTGSFDNPAGFAVSVAACYPFLLQWSALKKNKQGWLMGCLLVWCAAILSGSRTGILALAMVTILFLIRRYRPLLARHRKYLIPGAVLLLIILFAGLLQIKKTSTSGRYLITKVSLKAGPEPLLFGSGTGAIKSDYMPEQAAWFREHPESPHAILADNSNHPFNEFLLIWIESGLMGLLLAGLVLVSLFRGGKLFDSPYVPAVITVFIFCCFSYPFRYSFIWLIVIYCLSRSPGVQMGAKEFVLPGRIVQLIVSLLLIITGIFAAANFRWERQWKIAFESGIEKGYFPEHQFAVYQSLYRSWNGNPYFLFNYGAELKNAGNYREAIELLLYCERYYNDYDLQMHLAECYYQLEQWDAAGVRYTLASEMCPGRFLPLQGLLRTYMRLEETKLCIDMACLIVVKPVKIGSYTVSIIKMEAQDFLNKHQNSDL